MTNSVTLLLTPGTVVLAGRLAADPLEPSRKLTAKGRLPIHIVLPVVVRLSVGFLTLLKFLRLFLVVLRLFREPPKCPAMAFR